MTVESVLDMNYEDETAFRTFGGPEVLRGQCFDMLLANGCDPKTIALGEPYRENGKWKLQGTGEPT